MNEIINTILVSLLTLISVYFGWWLNKKERERKTEWEFYKEATIEVLSVINLLDTDIIIFNPNSTLEHFKNHLKKFNEIKSSLEILKDQESLNNFVEFYEATIQFTDETRKIKGKDKTNLENIDSYKLFKEKKEKWFCLIRKKLKMKK